MKPIPPTLPILAAALALAGAQRLAASARVPSPVLVGGRALTASASPAANEPRELTRVPAERRSSTDGACAQRDAAADPAPAADPLDLRASPAQLDALAERLAPQRDEELCAWIPFVDFLARHELDPRALSDGDLQPLFERYVALYGQGLAEFARLSELPGGEGAPDPRPAADASALEASAARFAAAEDRLADEFRPRG